MIQSPKQLKDMIRIVFNNFSNISDLKVVDLGCGLSQLLEYLYELGVNNLYGVDFLESIIIKNKEKY